MNQSHFVSPLNPLRLPSLQTVPSKYLLSSPTQGLPFHLSEMCVSNPTETHGEPSRQSSRPGSEVQDSFRTRKSGPDVGSFKCVFVYSVLLEVPVPLVTQSPVHRSVPVPTDRPLVVFPSVGLRNWKNCIQTLGARSFFSGSWHRSGTKTLCSLVRLNLTNRDVGPVFHLPAVKVEADLKPLSTRLGPEIRPRRREHRCVLVLTTSLGRSLYLNHSNC